ncbi:MAG TPA: transporter substrate-binding domain-containing protein [Actinomycetota bacterium]|nr:transporter substrate-binding domain-containing protein [Actinomycetota bacterium]
MTKARIWLAALVAVFALVVASCADEDGGGETATEPTGETAATGATGETAAIPEFTTLEEGVLQVGNCLDYPPFESVVDGDEVGFDIDLVEAIAERLGLTVEWIRADFDTVFTAVAGNQFDMVAAASTITEDREQIVDFSDPYYASRQSLTVNTSESPDITSTDQLGEGDIVNVQKGTTGKLWAEENLVPQGVELRTFQLASDMFRDLEAGNAVGIINDEPASVEIIKDLPDLEVVQAIDTNENYGFAFSPSNPELREAFNIGLQMVIADGTYAEIFEEYFPGVEVPEEYQPTA